MKRTKLFSNSSGIQVFRTTSQMLREAKTKKPHAPQLVSRYVDANGKKRFQGNQVLPESQPLS